MCIYTRNVHTCTHTQTIYNKWIKHKRDTREERVRGGTLASPLEHWQELNTIWRLRKGRDQCLRVTQPVGCGNGDNYQPVPSRHQLQAALDAVQNSSCYCNMFPRTLRLKVTQTGYLLDVRMNQQGCVPSGDSRGGIRFFPGCQRSPTYFGPCVSQLSITMTKYLR